MIQNTPLPVFGITLIYKLRAVVKNWAHPAWEIAGVIATSSDAVIPAEMEDLPTFFVNIHDRIYAWSVMINKWSKYSRHWDFDKYQYKKGWELQE